MAEAVGELVGFLTDSRAEVRAIAAQQVLALTTGDDKAALLKTDAIPQLCKIVGDLGPIARSAVGALINLSDSALSLDRMNKAFLVPKLMEGLAGESAAKHRRLSCMLLGNLTQTPEGSRQLMQIGGEHGGALVGLHLRRLLQWFLGQGAGAGEAARNTADLARPGAVRENCVHEEGDAEDEFEHVAHVLHNVTQIAEARALVMDPERGILPAVLPQLNHPSVIRRRGVAGMVRNCLLDCISDAAVVDYVMSDAISLLPQLMFVIAGPEEQDKDDQLCLPPSVTALGAAKCREPDAMVRRLVLETLVVLASTRTVRDTMRKVRLYPLLRQCHEAIEAAGGIEVVAGGAGEGESAPARAAASGGKDDVEVEVGAASKLGDEDELSVEAINKLVDFMHRDEAADADADAAAAADGDGDGDGATDGTGDADAKAEAGADADTTGAAGGAGVAGAAGGVATGVSVEELAASDGVDGADGEKPVAAAAGAAGDDSEPKLRPAGVGLAEADIDMSRVD